VLTTSGGGAPIPTLFISTTGSDSNPGTLAQPWAITSLLSNSANQASMVGQVIGMVAGTYATSGMQSTTSPGSFDTPVLTLPQGSAGNITTLVSCNSSGVYTQRVAILDNSSSTSGNPLIGQDPSHAGFWALDGLTIKGNPTNAAAVFMVTGRYAASTTGGTSFAASNITIQNCEIFSFTTTSNGGSNSGGVIMQGTTGTKFLNNYVHDIVATGSATNIEHCHGYEEFGCINSVIHFNTFANCQGAAVDIKTGCSGQDIANNYFYLCGTTDGGNGSGAITGCDGAEGNPNTPGTSYSIHHNIFDSCNSEISTDVNNVREQSGSTFNNTIYNSRAGSINPINFRVLNGASWQLFNTILVTTANSSGGGNAGSGGVALTTGGWSNVKNNCYFLHSSSSMWGQSGTNFSSLSAWQAATGSPDANSIAANPVFSSAITPGNGTTQFQLGSGSPCLGTGVGGVNMGAWDGTVTQIGCNFETAVS
jgi:hypothetical protein